MLRTKTLIAAIACTMLIPIITSFDFAAHSASAETSQTPSPVKATPNRDAYFPGTEDLRPDEMRIISLGTAMPFQRPAQAAPSFLVE